MKIFKIIGLMMTMSPIIMEIPPYTVPFSFLGFTLLILALLFDKQKDFLFPDILFWLSSIYYIYAGIFFLYGYFLALFLISQNLRLTLNTNNKFLSFTGFIGILSAFISVGFAYISIISLSCLLCLYVFQKNKKILVLPQKEGFSDVPLSEVDNPVFQEDDYVIPKE